MVTYEQIEVTTYTYSTIVIAFSWIVYLFNETECHPLT